MFTKFDKNLANYLVNNKIYIDCYNNNSNNQQQANNNNSQYSHEKANENDLKNFADEEEDCVINNLPDVNEIETYENLSEKHKLEFSNEYSVSCKQYGELNSNNLKLLSNPKSNSNNNMLSSPVSSLSSSCSSASPSSMLDNSKPIHSFKDHDSMNLTNKKLFNRNIHCVKEKIRRDRIKFSCNELRRLIPNLNGVKTDMASLLETSVLWIQLINSNIPEQLLINVQNKLENLKILRNNKQYLTGQKNRIDNTLKNSKLRINKNDLNENIDTSVKQEIYNPIQNNSLNSISPINTSFMNSLDTNSTSAIANAQSMMPKLSYQIDHATSNHISNNFIHPKPSKWLSITQQKYSDICSNRGSFQPEQDYADKCYMNTNNNNYSECEYHRIGKKPYDFNNNNSNNTNNNNIYLGQVLHNDQLENYSQNQQPISIDSSEASFSSANSTSNAYYQNNIQSNSCLF